LYHNGKTADIAAAQKEVDDYTGGDPNVIAARAQALTDATNKAMDALLTDHGNGAYMVNNALNQLMTGLLPNKVLQRVKHYL